MVIVVTMIGALALSLAFLFLFPSRPVTQPAGRRQIICELLLPGTSPLWRAFGGLALLAWCYFLVQDLLMYGKGSPYIIAMLAMPNPQRAYGIPFEGGVDEVFRIINPSWVWVYLAPTVLFATNLVLVLRSRRTSS